MCYIQLLLDYMVAAGRATFLKIRVLRGLNAGLKQRFAKGVRCTISNEKRFSSFISTTFRHPLGKSQLCCKCLRIPEISFIWQPGTKFCRLTQKEIG